jgi:succinate-semialdehyde dehydrogenase/glutarate-semialdehyde dehydrogenase
MAGVVRTHNPATAEVLADYPAFTGEQLDTVLDRAVEAAGVWADRAVSERAAVLLAVAGALRSNREELARLITVEMGKPIVESLGEIDKCAWNCEYVADQAESFLSDEVVETNATRSWVSYEPLGVVLAIMPWNFPFWQVLRFASAALIAGNAAVLKHSPNVTGCALAIEQLLLDAGLPEHVFTTIVLDESTVAQTVAGLIADDRISAVTLTGSERAGVSVGAAAGRALKKSVLELGGSDPLVVLDDADLEAAVAAATQSRFGNTGQSCVAAKRFIVAESVADEFVAALTKRVGALLVGDPLDPATRIGAMARPDLVDNIDSQVQRSIAEGANLVTGGERIPGAGCFYAPTILDHVRPGMTVFSEETFGPVAVVVRARDDDDAVALANDTPYGLGAAVWSSSSRGLDVGRRLKSGALFVNAVMASDPRLPFGGIRRSGYGRELAAAGVREFTNVRTIWLGDPDIAKNTTTVVTE